MKDEEKYTRFALVREMMEVPQIVKGFKLEDADNAAEQIQQAGRLFFTGEGSSRIFPAKNIMAQMMRDGLDIATATEGSLQAMEYDLSKFVVFAASNSGRTKETLTLVKVLRDAGHNRIFGLTANRDTKLESLADKTFVLSCGSEDAVAATKSIIEQAVFYRSLIGKIQGKNAALDAISNAYDNALTLPIDPKITEQLAKAGMIYFAGRNDGIAEELTLKVNEITHKKSDFLEGTYLLHGVEEVIQPGDAVILLDPYKSELELVKKLIADGTGANVFAIATEQTIFPTIQVKDAGDLTGYAYLAAGWNLLVDVGIGLGINIDKPERGRKIGAAFTEQ